MKCFNGFIKKTRVTWACDIQSGIERFLQEDRGDIISSLGWMAIMALALIAIKGIIDGKLVSYVNTVFVHLDRVFNP
jgi:hypothetical protein